MTARAIRLFRTNCGVNAILRPEIKFRGSNQNPAGKKIRFSIPPAMHCQSTYARTMYAIPARSLPHKPPHCLDTALFLALLTHRTLTFHNGFSRPPPWFNKHGAHGASSQLRTPRTSNPQRRNPPIRTPPPSNSHCRSVARSENLDAFCPGWPNVVFTGALEETQDRPFLGLGDG